MSTEELELLENTSGKGDHFVKIKKLKDSEFLYGVSAKEFKNKTYEEAIKFKIDCTKVLINELLTPHFMERDNIRINLVLSAQTFNTNLLKELEE